MTQEEKQLLFKDLCARLPYTPMVNVHGRVGYDRKLVSVNRYYTRFEFEIVVNSDDDEDYMPHNFEIEEIKPYLRPISSMTDEDYNKDLSAYLKDRFRNQAQAFGFGRIAEEAVKNELNHITLDVLGEKLIKTNLDIMDLFHYIP